jgi:hypothetical protein
VDEGVKIEQFVYPTSQLCDLDKLSAARIRARELGIPIHPVHIRTNPKMALEPDFLDWEDDLWDLMVLAPLDTETASGEVKSFKTEKPAGNPTSLVVLFAFESNRSSRIRGEGRILLTGDATTKILGTAFEVAAQSGLVLDNQLMIVPHHGGVGVLPEWLGKNIHGIAVISARTNSLHHPELETLQKLAARTCRNDEKKLFCTSYAQVCREQFEKSAETKDQHLVKEGPCFGHMVLRVPLSGPATYETSSHDGEQRRRFGWCGNIESAQT